MGPVSSDLAGKDLLERNPAALVVGPSLSLLLGQASVSLPPLVVLLPSLLFLLLSLCLGWLGWKRWAILFFLSAGALSLGYFRHHILLHPEFPDHHLVRLADGKSPLLVEGLLYREPERRSGRSRWYLKAERIWHPFGSQETLGNVVVTVRKTEREWHYGDRVRLRLRVRPPRTAGNPGEFDYAAYLARRQIYLKGFLKGDAGVVLMRRGIVGPRVWIENLRRKIRTFIDHHLPPREGGLLKALVVGDRGGLSSEDRERFVAAGVAHVLSISGLHVGMLGLVVFFLVRFFGSFSTNVMLRWNLFKAATFFSFLAVLFYTGLAGGRIPTVRSTIMVGVYALAVLLDREEEFYTSLALAALLIGTLWPGAIMDISFQLSFLAVLFIIWGLRRLQRLRSTPRRSRMSWERGRVSPWVGRLSLYLAVPVLATLGTGPMVAYHFGRLSLAGFIANPVIVPVVGFVLVPLSFLIGFLCLFSTPLALPLVWVSKPIFSFILVLVGFFSELPMANIHVPRPTLIELGALYLLACSFLVARRRWHFYAILMLSLVMAGGDAAHWYRERWGRRDLRITYLSVGHGDAAVVEFPGSKVLLIDAGGATIGFDAGESIVAPFLRSRRIAKVDYVLVTHPRTDHYGGVGSLLKEFSPSEFWSPPIGGKTRRYLELEKRVEALGVKRVILTRSDSCRWIGKVRLCFSYPMEGTRGESSVVVRLSLNRYHFLFPGDIKKGDEEKLVLMGTELSSQVLKVPRHGSRSSSTDAFVAAVKPKLAVFSVGRHRFGLPKEEVVARYLKAGSKVLRTDRDGAIVIETNGEELRFRTYRSGKKGTISS